MHPESRDPSGDSVEREPSHTMWICRAKSWKKKPSRFTIFSYEMVFYQLDIYQPYYQLVKKTFQIFSSLVDSIWNSRPPSGFIECPPFQASKGRQWPVRCRKPHRCVGSPGAETAVSLESLGPSSFLMFLGGPGWYKPTSCRKIHHFEWENPVFQWSCSIAMLNYQRVMWV